MSISLKQFMLTLFACVVLSQLGLRCARAESDYALSLEDDFGNTLQSFHHRGQVFAMGRMGQRYNLRVTNRSSRRVEAVVTVDGRDVMSGRPGDFQGQRGYLVPAYGSVLIEGFRTSLSEVAAFRFTTPGDSYSARMGSPENVGVIGAAFFSEAPPPPPPRPVYQLPRRRYPSELQKSQPSDGARGHGLGSGGPAAESRASAAPQSAPSRSYDAMESDSEGASNIGTQYGEQHGSQVVEVEFRRARPSRPDGVLVMRYDDREGLEARGIHTWPRPEPRVQRGPSAFPVNRFAPPPPPYVYN